MNKIRAFIAIPLPGSVQALLGDVSREWSSQIPERSVRWVKPHLMHVTLRFLGDTDIETVPSLASAMDRITAQWDSFTLRLDHPGCFPNTKRPRVVWVGLKGHLDAARSLKQEIDAALVPLGWELEERAFRPHLTIGRVKDSGNVKGFSWEANIEPLQVPVKEIHLIESKLQRSGPLYTVLHQSFLQN